ncbi:Hint domain-containing protein, partial [Streptomyces albidoflavus]
KGAAAARAAAKKAAQAAKKKAAEARAAATRAAKEAQKKTGNAVQKAAKTNATKTAAKTQSTTARKQSKGDDSSGPGKNRKPDEHEGASEGGSCPINKTDNSFTPGTAVMMADGTSKPIEDVAIGDTVLTTDPETGETSPQKVTATITGKGTKHLVDITLHTTDPESEAETESGTKSAGGKDPAPTTLTATDGHPFWVPQLDTWIDAADLNTGQYLQTSAGTRIQITAITQRTTQATVHNLTVAGTHTYYVVAGSTPVLVHNCNVSLSQREANTLRVGPHADESVPATGPVVTSEQSAAMQGRPCHSCGGSSPTMTGDHQPSTGIGPTSLPRSLFPHCETCSDTQAVAVSKAQQMLRNHGYHDPTFAGLPGIPSAAEKLAELLPGHTR